MRPEGRLFFVNAQDVAEQIGALVAQYKPRVLALDMSRVPDIEYSALQALMEGEKRATESGAVVWLVGLNPGVLEVVRNSGLDERLGRERMLFNAREAIEVYQATQGQALGSRLWAAAPPAYNPRHGIERSPEACPHPRVHAAVDRRGAAGRADHGRVLSLHGAEVRLRPEHLGRLGVLRLRRAGPLFQELQPLGEQHRPDGRHVGRRRSRSSAGCWRPSICWPPSRAAASTST